MTDETVTVVAAETVTVPVDPKVEKIEEKIETVKEEIKEEEKKPPSAERDERLDRLEKKMDDLYELLLSIVPAKAEDVTPIPEDTKPPEKPVEKKEGEVKADAPLADAPTEKKKRKIHFV